MIRTPATSPVAALIIPTMYAVLTIETGVDEGLNVTVGGVL
jgi:hypothetical protein